MCIDVCQLSLFKILSVRQYYYYYCFTSLLLTGIGVVAVACRGGWWRFWVHGGRIFILGATCLDGPQVAVAAWPEACRCRQIQRLHCLWFPLAVRYRPKTLTAYLKERVQTHTLRAEGRLCNMHLLQIYTQWREKQRVKLWKQQCKFVKTAKCIKIMKSKKYPLHE